MDLILWTPPTSWRSQVGYPLHKSNVIFVSHIFKIVNLSSMCPSSLVLSPNGLGRLSGFNRSQMLQPFSANHQSISSSARTREGLSLTGTRLASQRSAAANHTAVRTFRTFEHMESEQINFPQRVPARSGLGSFGSIFLDSRGKPAICATPTNSIHRRSPYTDESDTTNQLHTPTNPILPTNSIHR